MRSRIAQSLLIVVGLLILAYPLTIGADPDVTCRGVVMQPGGSCLKSDGSAAQTFEQRQQTVTNAKPVIIVVGLLVAAFGAYLLTAELRKRSASSDPTSRPEA